MSYPEPLKLDRVEHDVALLARVDYQDYLPAGMMGCDLKVPILWDLKENSSRVTSSVAPYKTGIGDLEIRISEVNAAPPGSGVTNYQVIMEQIAFSRGGRSLLRDILNSDELVSLLTGILQTAAGAYNPFFAPILAVVGQAVFRRAGKPHGNSAQSRTLKLHFLQWWALKVWKAAPGTLPLVLGIGYTKDPMRAATSPVQLTGEVTYELMITAETGALSPFRGFRKTGVIRLGPAKFKVNWYDLKDLVVKSRKRKAKSNKK